MTDNWLYTQEVLKYFVLPNATLHVIFFKWLKNQLQVTRKVIWEAAETHLALSLFTLPVRPQ